MPNQHNLVDGIGFRNRGLRINTIHLNVFHIEALNLQYEFNKESES